MKENSSLDNKKIISLVSMLCFLIVIIGASFAYFGSFNKNISKGKVNITIDVGANATFVTSGVDLNIVIPPSKMVQYEAGTKAIENNTTLDVTLTSGNAKIKTTCTFDIYYEYNQNSSIYGDTSTPVTDAFLKELTLKMGGDGTSDYSLEKNFNIDSNWINNSKRLVVKNATISDATTTGTTKSWDISMAFYNLDKDQNKLAGKTFSGTFYVEKDSINCDNETEKTLLYDTIAKRYNNGDEYVKLYNGADYGDTTNYANNIYYFTGNVENNNVLFANYCWKIVRTTETGGVKIVYNGTLKDGSCNNTGTDSQIGTSAFNSSYNTPAYVGYMYNTVYKRSGESSSSLSNIVFGNSFAYEKDTNTYTLKDTMTVATWSSGYNTINNNHYTCMTTGTTCSSIYYVYYTDSSYAFYITLTGGKSVNDALNEMLYADDVNTKDSTIKAYIDSWYEEKIKVKYNDKLEDTVFCNDRSISSLGGWNPNGGNTLSELQFKNSDTSNKSLVCANETDRFSVSSTKAKLNYPIGLLTLPELSLANYGSSHYFNSGQVVRLGSPRYFSSGYYANNWVVNSGGLYTSDFHVYRKAGVRPAVSLKPGTTTSSGDGSYTSPFVIE